MTGTERVHAFLDARDPKADELFTTRGLGECLGLRARQIDRIRETRNLRDPHIAYDERGYVLWGHKDVIRRFKKNQKRNRS